MDLLSFFMVMIIINTFIMALENKDSYTYMVES